MDLRALDLSLGLAPTVSYTLALAIALIYFVLVRDRRGPRADEGFWYRYYHWFVGPVANLMGRLGVSPNAITAASLLLAAACAVAIGEGVFLIATWLMTVAVSCDVLDGEVARRFDRGSPSGAFFDSFADRVSEGLLFGGIAYYGQGGLLTWLSVATLVASFSVSYARARAESLGVNVKVGLMQRPARLVATIFAILFGAMGQWLPWAWAPSAGRWAMTGLIGVVCLLSMHTAWQRVILTIKLLDAKRSSAPSVSAGHDAILPHPTP